MNFAEKLNGVSQRNRSWLCVGLDPDPELMPIADILEFNRRIVDATRDLVCAYKLNFAFYEAQGSEGVVILEKTINHIGGDVVVVGDAKRGDIGNTARAYARALFVAFGCDAATVNPYLGWDSVEPFADYRDKGVFVLCHTSNPGARDFQDIRTAGGGLLYELVAEKARAWDKHGNIGLVVGATYPEQLKRVRRICPEMTFLVPGIGAQGGSLEMAVKHGAASSGGGVIIAVSRQVLYASSSGDFAEAARRAADGIRRQINGLLSAAGGGG